MSETTIVTKEEILPPPTVAESQLQMAVTFGQMTEANRQVLNEIAETKAQFSHTSTMLTEALQEIRALKSQTDITSHRAEQLSESQTAIISAITDNSEKDESKEAIPVTPMETKIEIEQKPANMQKSLFQRIFF